MAFDERADKETAIPGNGRLLKECPLCNAAFLPEDTVMVFSRLERRIIHITCRGCGHFLLADVEITPGGMSLFGVVTDLSLSDVKRHIFMPAISADEPIGLHELMRRKDFFKNFMAATAKRPTKHS